MKHYDLRLLFLGSILLFLSVLTTLTATAQEGWMNRKLVYNNLTVTDGLLSNTIRSICQDKYGRLWIGSGRGVDIYDGHRFTSRRIHDINVAVYSLCEGEDRMWIGTNAGLFYLDFQNDSIYPFRQKAKRGEMVKSYILNIHYDQQGDLWFTSYNQGVFRLSHYNNSLTSYMLPNNEKRSCTLLTDKNGTLWSFRTGGDNCLDRFNTRTETFENYPLMLDGKPIDVKGRTLVQTPDGKILLGSVDGTIYSFEDGSHDVQKFSFSEKPENIYCMTVAADSVLIVGAEAGLFFIDTKTGESRRYVSATQVNGALSDHLVLSLFLDREETLWVGTFFGGLNYTNLEFSNFTSYQPSPTFPIAGKIVDSFAEDDEGNIWMGCDDGGLCVFDPKTKIMTRRPKNDIARNIQSIDIRDGKMAIGTHLNGFILEDLRTHHVKHFPQLNDTDGNYLGSSVQKVLIDDDGTIWLGTDDKILTYKPGTNYFTLQKNETSFVNHISKDNKGRLWFSTRNKGVMCYNKKSDKWKDYNGSEDDPTADFYRPNSVFCDSKGTIWMCMTQGLYRLDTESNRFDSDSEEIAALDILGGIDVGGGNLCLISSIGIIHYLPDEHRLAQVFRSGRDLHYADFVPDAFFMNSTGVIYAGTSDGFISFTPSQLLYNENKPQVRFTGFDLFGEPAKTDEGEKPIIQADTIYLNHDENVFTIHFSAMSFVNPKDNRYSYYLEGFDRDRRWSKVSNATYTNLPSGTYVFHLMATNNDGVWNDDDVLLTIIVEPPFYWSLPAKILYTILAIIFIVYAAWLLERRGERKALAKMKFEN
jgi:ligand-binding sensor domain-containing protein